MNDQANGESNGTAAPATMLSYGTSTAVDFATLPAASQVALARRGWSHYLGNEQSSKLTGWKDKFAADNKAAGKVDAEGNGIGPTEAEIESKKAEFIESAVKALLDGTIGTRASGGPRLLPFDQAVNDIAKAEVLKVLRENNIKPPKGDEVVKFPDGERTMAQMISTRIDKHGDRIRKEATKRVAESKRLADKAAAVKAAGGAVNAADLGL